MSYKFPKGYLIAIGGAEDRGKDNADPRSLIDFSEHGVLKTLVELISGKAPPVIEVVTTASSVPDELFKEYKSAFKKLECLDVGHLKIESREEADHPKNLERLKRASCIFFTGGDQLRLCALLGGTKFLQIVKDRYKDDYFFVAGTSAGAAAMSGTIITGGGKGADGYLKGQIKLSVGFGFIHEAIIDTHFDERGRLARLLQAIAYQPGTLGIGLSENTGVIVEKGHILKAIGSGCVVIVEGSMMSYNNVHQIEDNAPITLGNVLVHTLTYSDEYDMYKKVLTPVPFRPYEK